MPKSCSTRHLPQAFAVFTVITESAPSPAHRIAPRLAPRRTGTKWRPADRCEVFGAGETVVGGENLLALTGDEGKTPSVLVGEVDGVDRDGGIG